MIKLIALITMIIDHIGVVIINSIPYAHDTVFTFGRINISVYSTFRIVGRIAFPLYVFLLVEGFIHTHDRKKYGINLLIFAVISEVPWNLEHTGTMFYKEQNVFFTLLFGYVGLCCYERFKDDRIKQLLSLSGLFIIAYIFKADYGVIGYAFILFMYTFRTEKIVRSIVGSCFFSLQPVILFSFLLMSLYNGERGFIKGKTLKYLFYAAYPMHIFVLYLIKLKYIGYS